MIKILPRFFSFLNLLRWHLVVRPYRILITNLQRISYLEIGFENCETMRFKGTLIKNLFIPTAKINVSCWTQQSSLHKVYVFDEGEFSILLKKYTNYPTGDKIKKSKVKRFDLLKTKSVIIDEEILKRINYRDITSITIKQPFKKPIDFTPQWRSYEDNHPRGLDLINISQSNYLTRNDFITCKKSLRFKHFIDIHGDFLTIKFSNDAVFLKNNKKEIKKYLNSKDWRLK